MSRNESGPRRASALYLGVVILSWAMSGAALAQVEKPGVATVAVTIHADQPGAIINPNVYGQFAEHLGAGIYGGVWVGEKSAIPNTNGYRNDVIKALKDLHVPVVRWPGGCFADEYHWRKGIGPADRRPRTLNPNWGGVIEPNGSFEKPTTVVPTPIAAKSSGGKVTVTLRPASVTVMSLE